MRQTVAARFYLHGLVNRKSISSWKCATTKCISTAATSPWRRHSRRAAPEQILDMALVSGMSVHVTKLTPS